MKRKHGLFRVQRLRIFTDGYTWMVAYDQDDAKLAFEEYTRDRWDQSYEPFCEVVPDRKAFSVFCDPDCWDYFWKNRPLFSRRDLSDPYRPTIVAPAWAWVLKNGRGFLSSTEY